MTFLITEETSDSHPRRSFRLCPGYSRGIEGELHLLQSLVEGPDLALGKLLVGTGPLAFAPSVVSLGRSSLIEGF